MKTDAQLGLSFTYFESGQGLRSRYLRVNYFNWTVRIHNIPFWKYVRVYVFIICNPLKKYATDLGKSETNFVHLKPIIMKSISNQELYKSVT